MAMHVWWQDEREYYFVCDACYQAHSHEQWRGNSRLPSYVDRQRYFERIERKREKATVCEGCGPGGIWRDDDEGEG